MLHKEPRTARPVPADSIAFSKDSRPVPAHPLGHHSVHLLIQVLDENHPNDFVGQYSVDRLLVVPLHCRIVVVVVHGYSLSVGAWSRDCAFVAVTKRLFSLRDGVFLSVRHARACHLNNRDKGCERRSSSNRKHGIVPIAFVREAEKCLSFCASAFRIANVFWPRLIAKFGRALCCARGASAWVGPFGCAAKEHSTFMAEAGKEQERQCNPDCACVRLDFFACVYLSHVCIYVRLMRVWGLGMLRSQTQ
jgi:hypothetical protein